MVGRRQVTLSVYRQLDRVDAERIEPFGRVRDGQDGTRSVYVVGIDTKDGTLVRASVKDWPVGNNWWSSSNATSDSWRKYGQSLPHDIRAQLGVRCFDGSYPQDKSYFAIVGPRPTFGYLAVECHRSEKNREPAEGLRLPDLPADVVHEIRRLESAHADEDARRERWSALPLIVLAGLR